MSNFNGVELKNQNLRQTTTMDSSAFANLPGEELSEQDLDAVSGGNPMAALLQFLSTATVQTAMGKYLRQTKPKHPMNVIPRACYELLGFARVGVWTEKHTQQM